MCTAVVSNRVILVADKRIWRLVLNQREIPRRTFLAGIGLCGIFFTVRGAFAEQLTLTPAQNWTGKKTLTYKVKTLEQGTSTAAVIKVGNAYLWCQGDFGVIPAATEASLEVDLTKMSCGVPDLSKVQEMYVWFSGGGTYYLDAVKIQ